MIDIQERPLGPLEQEPLALGEGLMQPGRRVPDEGPQSCSAYSRYSSATAPASKGSNSVKHRRQQAILVVDDPAQPLAKNCGMEKVRHPDPVNPTDLVAIARPDPPPGGSQVVGRGAGLLGQSLLGQVIGQDHMGPVADVQPIAKRDPLRRRAFRSP